MRWLEPFQRCFGHRAQRLALRTYVHGVFSDSERKSMQAMLARVTQPVSYQAFQHFITHAPWEAERIWRRLLDVLPERRGVLILDGTSFPKQGPHSVGIARQYCGALWVSNSSARRDWELEIDNPRRRFRPNAIRYWRRLGPFVSLGGRTIVQSVPLSRRTSSIRARSA